MTKFKAMKSFQLMRAAWLWLAITGVTAPLLAQHAHIYAGAANQTPGTPLFFQNADLWDTNSYGGYTQAPACNYFADNYPALYPGLYQTVTTFSALPATIFTGGPSPYAAAFGTYVELKFVSLQGPPGGVLTVWSEIDNPANPSVVLTLSVGTTSGTNRFHLSEGDPLDPESDPYGHIHGRRLTLSKPGLYVVGLQLLDTARNGPGGGSTHTPSTTTYFYLQAGLHLGNFSRSNNVTTARFGLPGFANYALEASPVLPGTNWSTVTNLTGLTRSELRWVRDNNATATNRYYRLRKTN